MSLSPKGKAQVSDPPKSRCLQLVHVTELPAGVPEHSLPQVPGKGSPGIAHYIWMRELGSPAWCRCVLGTPSLSRLLAAVGADGQTQGSASCAGGAALLRRRRRSLGAEAAAVLCLLHQPSLSFPAQPQFAQCGCCSTASCGAGGAAVPSPVNARTGMSSGCCPGALAGSAVAAALVQGLSQAAHPGVSPTGSRRLAHSALQSCVPTLRCFGGLRMKSSLCPG